jgi:hypothetical protein
MTKVIPDKRVEFVIERMGRGAFEAQANGDTVTFVAELDIGSDAPIVGRFVDFIISRLFNQRIESMRQHMAEEGRNLKTILESGSPSA